MTSLPFADRALDVASEAEAIAMDLGWLYTHPQVLVVDDDEDVRDLVCAIVESRGLETVQAEDGSAALIAAMQRPFDVIIMDLIMPGADGHEICRQMVDKVLDRGTPVIMMTADRKPVHRSESYQAGAVAHLTKPIRREELLRLVDDALDHVVATRRSRHATPAGRGPAPAALAPSTTVDAARPPVAVRTPPSERDLRGGSFVLTSTTPVPASLGDMLRAEHAGGL